LDDQAALITYEEYYPYGSTSFQSGRSVAEVSLKRYRFTGKEHDSESGFRYHGARYYAPWLGRWTSCDPVGALASSNLYEYCASDPCNKLDASGTEWCWNPFASDCGVDWDMVKQAAASAEVVFGCGGTLLTDGLTVGICLDGVDNWTATTMDQPTAKQVIVSGGLRLAGVDPETADYAGAMTASVISAALSAEGIGQAYAGRIARRGVPAPYAPPPSSTPTVPAGVAAEGGAGGAAKSAGSVGRTVSRSAIKGGTQVKDLDNSMFQAITDSEHAAHSEATSWLARNRSNPIVLGRPAYREAARTDNALTKRILEAFHLRADISLDIPDLAPLARRYQAAFEGTGIVFKEPDALNLASAQMSGRTLVTRDYGLYKRARDLGVTAVEYVGSPENMKNAANYRPRPVKY
jgi:RHS repeat-associated protein